ncbi:glyoxalase/bleomycin resistance/extradiol dioxygenase family protein [Alkalilimnicola ehrlichii]|uniref:Glyoxalase/bleomycin resistance/extradiol dioxygenase family protein n=1 Tax=Alkalilimnicola ehrlichii TaxID=351052 RepID=A0A3E0WV80_9GAMM|nr:VOC family protein [Alkalilimnicola ehrlichii]RFA29371.1 glyoxalase/bleomycin resistance/extradiol dioxygenase family protein [Alkalilimnicola ehrlichii]RFA36884.1 glyoxalase/bleomycin resistance/extradiol dioxygenase family protein [Alkalilimnicola ehrlichii]
MKRAIYINLAVRDLARAIGFYRQLGFELNERFCDETAACVVIEENIVLMLLTDAKFQGFAPNSVCDTRHSNEVLLCLGVDSREGVDALVRKAVAAGGGTFAEPVDHGFMYQHSFQDPDGHVWELIHMAEETVQGQ